MKYFFVLVLTFAFLSGAVFAAPPPAPAQKTGRTCLVSDLVGTWELKGFNSKTKVDPKNPSTWMYQRFLFDKKGNVKEMTSREPIEGNKAAVRKFENALSTSKYGLDERGILSVTKLELPYPEKCLCIYVMKDLPPETIAKVPEAKRAGLPRKGDVLLTYFGRDGKPHLSKNLRRV